MNVGASAAATPAAAKTASSGRSTSRRPNRSIRAPATGAMTIPGSVAAAMTYPAALAEVSKCRTISGRAGRIGLFTPTPRKLTAKITAGPGGVILPRALLTAAAIAVDYRSPPTTNGRPAPSRPASTHGEPCTQKCDRHGERHCEPRADGICRCTVEHGR